MVNFTCFLHVRCISTLISLSLRLQRNEIYKTSADNLQHFTHRDTERESGISIEQGGNAENLQSRAARRDPSTDREGHSHQSSIEAT